MIKYNAEYFMHDMFFLKTSGYPLYDDFFNGESADN